MAKQKKKSLKKQTLVVYYRDLENKEIQHRGNLALQMAVQNLDKAIDDIFWGCRSQEDQLDKGIDFEYELTDKKTRKTLLVLKIQNKGTNGGVEVLKTTKQKGKISFPIKVKHVRYYRYEINLPVIFTVCDLKTNKVYWHPIQLDDQIDQRAEEAENNNQESTTLYIDPKRYLRKESAERFLQEIKESDDQQRERLRERPLHKAFEKPEAPFIDRSKHILDQLYDFLNAYGENFRHVPIAILKKQYPFKSSKDFYPFREDFRLSTDNTALIELTQQLEFEDHKTVKLKNPDFFTGVKNAKKKAQYVFTALSNNLVFDITDKNNHKSVHTHLRHRGSLGTSADDYYEALDYTGVLTSLRSKDLTVREQMSKAYVHYRLCNFVKAGQLFEIISKTASDNPGLNFICQFNLNKLARFIRSRYDEKEKKELFERWLSIDLAALAKKHKVPFVELLDALATSNFYRDIRYELDEVNKKISNHYHSQLGGGWTSQKSLNNLLSIFADLDQLLEMDYLVFNHFSDFLQVFEDFAESLFALHAMNDEQPGKLGAFIDWMVHRLVFNGTPSMLVRLFNKYHLKQIKYNTSETPMQFHKLARNILTLPRNFRERMNAVCENVFDDFWRSYNNQFGNIMVLMGLLELDEKFVNEIAVKLLKYLRREDVLFPVQYEHITTFLEHKRKLISPANRLAFLRSTFTNKKTHFRDWFEMLMMLVNADGNGFVLQHDDFSSLNGILFDKCKVCEQQHDLELLPQLWKVLNDPGQKAVVASQITKVLEGEFNDDFVYYGVLMDAVEMREEWKQRFIEMAMPRPNRVTFKSMFGGEPDMHIYSLDILINLGLKLGWDFTDPAFASLRGIHDYYDWLLDMEAFDYAKFKPRWLKEYGTYYYYESFRKHPNIRKKLEEYLDGNYDPQMLRVYFILYKENTDKLKY